MEPGGFDMQQIFAAAQQMQAQLSERSAGAREQRGDRDGGRRRRARGRQRGRRAARLTIDPGVIDTSDPAETAATVADLVLAAVRDAWDPRRG